MGREWTEEQKAVIRHRGRNLLVSAAAGSGKTAVLVERIISLVTDREHPTDIDRLLIVTFTRAAAGEMKERLSRALEQALLADPDNAHLQEQTVLIHHAEITTIHGFCTYVIQNYYQTIGIDPGYRIAEEGELQLLRGDVMDEMLEEEYAADNNDAFLAFMEAYAPGRDDSAADELIQKVYDFSMSHPDPAGWLDSCLKSCSAGTDEELSESLWMRAVLSDTALRLQGIRRRAEENLESARKAELGKYIEVLENDLEAVRKVQQAAGYGGIQTALAELRFVTWPRLGAKEKAACSEEQLAEITRLKDARPRDEIAKLKKEYFADPEDRLLEDLQKMQPYMAELVRLVGRFRESFSEKKREKNLADFTDLEHLALQILVRKEEGGFVRTDAARELAGRFDEVMTDEYQDSSALQETILEAVSGSEEGRFDRFMVGDMKQSIYGFRMARPSIFLDKFKRYPDDPCAERIDLTKNFRSRHEVLDTVNAFFTRLMIPELGGIRYDDAQALHFGASYYPDSPNPDFPKAELLLLNRQNPDFADYNTQNGRMELEAAAAAARIREIVGKEQVFDTDTGKYRPACYRDCVILLRATKGWSDVFVKTLQDSGIPAYSVSKVGYFGTQEVQTVLNYLSIIGNPKQDIPMAAVLRSPIVGCTDEELAKIRIASPESTFFDAVEQYVEEGGRRGGARAEDAGDIPDTIPEEKRADFDEKLYGKLASFLGTLCGFRERSAYTPVHELIEQILEQTGYGMYAAAMPGGRQREANLRMLVEKAVTYERTSYHGVFNFIRYIDRLQKYQVDYGEVNVFSEKADTVRVMSIHQSKGLEFPVVFVAGTGKNFNQTDENKPVVMHAELGIGMKLVDVKTRMKSDTVLRTAIRRRMEQDDKGEELRILYVAMTRAREKIILTGVASDEKELDAIRQKQAEQDQLRRLSGPRVPLAYDSLMQAKSYLDWIGLAVPESAVLQIREIEAEDIILPEAEERIRVRDRIRQVEADSGQSDFEKVLERSGRKEEEKAQARNILAFVRERDAFRYPYLEAAELPAKMTVSELKRKRDGGEAAEIGQELFPEQEETPYIPSFMQAEESGKSDGGAARGTVIHHFLQCLDYRKLPERDEDLERALEEQMRIMQKRGIFSEEEAGMLDPAVFLTFLRSDLGRRMRRAANQGQLRREQPFVLDLPASEIREDWPEGENILIQGIIDAYFPENGRYILVDYKTDRVNRRDGGDLIRKYTGQLNYYRRALEEITGIPVAQMWIYSTALGRALQVPVQIHSE